MEGNKEKTVVVTTSRDILSKTHASLQQQQPQQPLLLTAGVASAAAASIAPPSSAQYLQQSSSDILRQSFALKPNMPPSNNSVSSASSGGPRPIAPAPPGVLKATPHTVGSVANVASIIRAPTAGSPSSVVGYSGIVGVTGAGVPKSVMMTQATTGNHALTAPPGAILRSYPLPPPNAAGARLPLASPSAADPAARFQVTIVPSRASPTSGATVPGAGGVSGIVQLQPRAPSVSLSHQLPPSHAAVLSSSTKPAPVAKSPLATSIKAAPQQQPMQQPMQHTLKPERGVPATTVCLVPNIVPVAKVFPPKPSTIPTTISHEWEGNNALTAPRSASDVAMSAATSDLITQLISERRFVPSGAIVTSGSTVGASGAPPFTKSVYLPMPIPSSNALMVTSTSSGAVKPSSTIAAIKIPSPAGLTTVSAAAAVAAALPPSSMAPHGSAVNLGQLATMAPAGVAPSAAGAAQFLPYYASSITGSALQSLAVASTTQAAAAAAAAAASSNRGAAAAPIGQTATALLVPAAAVASAPSATASSASQKRGIASTPQLLTSALPPHLVATATAAGGGGRGTQPQSMTQQHHHPLASQHHSQLQGIVTTNIPILKVPNVSGNSALTGVISASNQQSVNTTVAATAPALHTSSAALAVGATTTLHISAAVAQSQQLTQQPPTNVGLQPQLQQPFSASAPISMMPLPRPILVSTSSVPFTNPNVSPRPSILRKRPESGSGGAAAAASARVDSLTPQDCANLITAASAAVLRKGLFQSAVGAGAERDVDIGAHQSLRSINSAISPGRSIAPTANRPPDQPIRETSSQSSTDSAQSDGGYDEEDDEDRQNTSFKLHKPNATGPTDFTSALMIKPPIISQPPYHLQQQQLQQPQQHQSPQRLPLPSQQQQQPVRSVEVGAKRLHASIDVKKAPLNSPASPAIPAASSTSATAAAAAAVVAAAAAAAAATSDVEMSPRKRLRKQQLLTKNDASAASVNAEGVVTAAGTAASSSAGLSSVCIAGRNLQLDFHGASGVEKTLSAASSSAAVSRQLVFQPNFSAAPMNPSARNEVGHNGTKEAAEAEAGWGAAAQHNAGVFESAKGDESSVSSDADEEEEEEVADGGDEGEYDPSHRGSQSSRAVLKKPKISLLSFYHCNWKTRTNHFQTYAEIKIKEEKKASVSEIANQHGINQRASGWRLYSVSSQLEDVIDEISDKHTKLFDLQKSIKESASAAATITTSSVMMKSTTKGKKGGGGGGGCGGAAGEDRDPLAEDLRAVNEFFEGNLQRFKLTRDQMDEAKDAMLKLLEHKAKAKDIIAKHHKKRNAKSQAVG